MKCDQVQHSPGLLRLFRNEGRDLKLHRFGPFPLRHWVPMSWWGAEVLPAVEPVCGCRRRPLGWTALRPPVPVGRHALPLGGDPRASGTRWY